MLKIFILQNSQVLFVLLTCCPDRGLHSRTEDHIRGPRANSDQGPRINSLARSPFFRITRKIFQFGTCHFKVIPRDIKAVLRENFSALRFVSGKTLKILIFTRRPRTLHCILSTVYISCDF